MAKISYPKLPRSAPNSIRKPICTPNRGRRASTTSLTLAAAALPPDIIRHRSAPHALPTFDDVRTPTLNVFPTQNESQNSMPALTIGAFDNSGDDADTPTTSDLWESDQSPLFLLPSGPPRGSEEANPAQDQRPDNSGSPRGSTPNDPFPDAPSSRESSSDDATSTPYSKAADIDDKIHKRLRHHLNSSDKPVNGVVYIFKVLGEHNLYKIGTTGDVAKTRRDRISSKCKLRIETVHVSEQRMKFATQAEKLSHKELIFHQELYECRYCGTTHTEFFRVSDEIAKAVVLRWEKFLLQEPYGSDGALSPFWLHRLGKHLGPPETERHDQHIQRGRRWNEFISPTKFDRHIIWIASVFEKLKNGYHTFEFWKKPMWFLWLVLFMVMVYDGDFYRKLALFKVTVIILQALPICLVGATVLEQNGKSRRKSSG